MFRAPVIILLLAILPGFSDIIVTSNEDSGPGTLRQAILDIPDGEIITFATELSGETIALTTGHLYLRKSMTIDGTSLARAIKIDAGGLSRVIRISTNRVVTLNHLELTNGRETVGGCILNKGPLTISRCTLHNNHASQWGGAIINESNGFVTMDHCTVVHNSAGIDGSIVYQEGNTPSQIHHSTLARNRIAELENTNADSVFQRPFSGGFVQLYHSVVSSNSYGSGYQLFLGSRVSVSETQPSFIGKDALLGPFGYHGGSIPTVVPLAGSPLIDAGLESTAQIDQRGAARLVGAAIDLGSNEYGAIPEFNLALIQNPVVTLAIDREDFSSNRDGLSLREAIALAAGGSNITFDPSFSGQTFNLTLGTLAVRRPMTLEASDLAEPVTVSGENLFRVIRIDPESDCHLKHLRIINGNAGEGEGGGIYCAASLTLTECVIRDCQASAGGGMMLQGPYEIRESSILQNQSVNRGGGVFARFQLTPGSVTRFILNSTLAYNTAGESGGAVSHFGQARLMTMRNCTIAHNEAAEFGGGIYGRVLDLVSCTISKNMAGLRNGGVFAQSLNLEGSIVCENLAPLQPNFSDPDQSIPGSLINVEAHLGELAENGGPTTTMLPLPNSPAIDPEDGRVAGLHETDQRGNFRLSGSSTDHGAVESGSMAFPEPLAAPVVTALEDKFTRAGEPDLTNLSLREATTFARPGAVITFAPSLQNQTIELSLGEIDLFQKVTIDGDEILPVISGNSLHRVFHVAPEAEVTLANLHLTAGFSEESGGGIYNRGRLTLNHCEITNCESFEGGAIYLEERSEMTASHFVFSNNKSRSGGACALAQLSMSQFRTGTFHGNDGGIEGGAIMARGICSILDTTFSNNSSGRGGAIYANSEVEINTSTLAQNTASTGGAIYLAGNLLTLTHVTIARNSDTNDVGGIYVNGGQITAANSIISQNFSSGPNFPARNGIPNINGPIDHDLGGNVIDENAFLSPLGDYGGPNQTIIPLSGSPALDIAQATSLTTDQRGAVRTVGAAPDAGATERQAFPNLEIDFIVDPVITRNDDPEAPDLEDLSLRHALSLAAPDSTVTFAPALSGETIEFTQGEILLSQNVTIDGSNLAAPPVLKSGINTRHLVVPLELTLGLSGLVIEGARNRGDSPEIGGGIDIYGQAEINQCTFRFNSAVWGGAMHANPTARVTIVRSSFFENQAGRGGALHLEPLASATLTNTTLAHNSASQIGGGIFSQGNLTVDHCTLSLNSADQAGGGIAYISGQESAIAISQSIIAGNHALELSDFLSPSPLKDDSNLIAQDPLLAPLGNYGGPTLTMPPLAGSPAIDSASSLDPGPDQRSATRNIGAAADLGATEAGGFPDLEPMPIVDPVVTRFDDEHAAPLDLDDLNLRQAIALATPGSVITFADPAQPTTISLSGRTIINSRQLHLNGSTTAGPMVISGSNTNGIFKFTPSSEMVLDNIHLSHGRGTSGGAIANLGSLTLNTCQVENCVSTENGGGIFNGTTGDISMTATSIDRNEAQENGGGIANFGTMDCLNSTVSRNVSTGEGAGIYTKEATLSLLQVTIAENRGDGALTLAGGTTEFIFTTISSNSGGNALKLSSGTPNTISSDSSVVSGNYNNNASRFLFPISNGDGLFFSDGDPFLAPLGNYGGPTETMPPLAGSPLIDAGGSPTQIQDQRGGNRAVGAGPDLGACEAGSLPELEPTPLISPVVTTLSDTPGAEGLSLRQAINLSSPGAVITFSPDLSAGTINLEQQEYLVLRPVTIDSGNPVDRITLDGNKRSRHFIIPSNSEGMLTIRSFNLINGLGTQTGGGSIFSFKELEIYDCHFEGNQSGFGGALYILGDDGSLVLERSQFRENSSSSFGGAIILSGPGTLTDCRFENNQADSGSGAIAALGGGITRITGSTFLRNLVLDGNGGAINASNQVLHIDQSVFAHNEAGSVFSSSNGGAIFINSGSEDSPATITNSTFHHNQARNGGAIYKLAGFVEVNNSTFTMNEAFSTGGGIYNDRVGLSLEHCTISGNLAGLKGGGLNSQVLFECQNSILSGNLAETDPDYSTFAAISLDEIGNYIGGDARLEPLGNYGGPTPTMLPMGDSPVIDLGISPSSEFDQRLLPRIVGDLPDAGAVEFRSVAEELEFTFNFDSDSDGSSNALEFTLGRNPYQADPDSPRDLKVLTPFPSLSFGFNPASEESVTLKITRSFDLLNFDTTILSNETESFPDPNQDMLLLIEDLTAPLGRPVFYRLEVTPR